MHQTSKEISIAPPQRGRPKKHRQCRGFTLVEVAAAVTVFTVGTLGLLGAQVSSQNLIRTSNETSVASTELEVAMEQILTVPITQIPTANGFLAGQPIDAFTNRTLRGQRVVPTYPGLNANSNAVEIVLTISWTSFDGRPRNQSLATVRAQ